MSVGNKREYVFEGVTRDLFYAATVFTDHMVMMWLERLRKLSKRCPATYRGSRDAEFSEEFECAVDACSVYLWCALGDLAIFKWFVCMRERLKYSLTRFGDTLAGCFED